MGSLVLEHAIKVRKPYTITKERERWTEEEHNKFLEALKLYGRAWRQIEEHIGSKTAVQIRSHAQKFFTKAVRESKTVEIPPPRPKKRPMHPYPRKLGKKFPVSEQDDESPSSVLSSTSDRTNGCTSPASSVAGSDPVGSIDNGSVEAPLASLKLFGKTVVVAEGQKPPCFDTEDAEPAIAINEVISEGGSIQWNQWASSAASMYYLLPSHGNLLPWFWAFSGEHQSSVRNCSDDGGELSINGLKDGGEVLVKLRRSETSAFRSLKATPREGTKGFVPYKRCVSERGGENQKAIDEV